MGETLSARPLIDGARAGRSASGPCFGTVLGFLAAFRRDPLGFLSESWHAYGDAVEIRFRFPSHWRSYMFFDPEAARHVLQENHRNYAKGIVFQKLKRIAGEGLVFSDGELWRRQRQLIQPTFHRERIAAMADMMVDTTAAALARWSDAATGRPFDLAAALSKLTLEIVSKALFGTSLGAEQDDFAAAVTAALEYANHVTNHFFTPPLFVPTRANRRGRDAIGRIDRIVWKIIEQRRREGSARHDLLGMLISARDADTDTAMDDKQLRDEVVTFLVAGHETTAVALSWACHLLSRHPEIEQRLHEQIDAAIGSKPPALAELNALPYARMVLEESMRLYPPVWATIREARAEDQVGGFRVPAAATVTVSPWITHRHPRLWEDPERFDPERFTPERSAARPDFAYFPFGGGPRGCVGRQFAMIEGQILLTMIAQRFRLHGVAGDVIPDPILTLRPRNGLAMRLEPR
jgi:cytochrome P450